MPSGSVGRDDYMKLLLAMIDRLRDEEDDVVDAQKQR